jgi:hypothetical protein
MKRCILNVGIVGLLSVFQVGMASNYSNYYGGATTINLKKETKTSLSPTEEAELRKAVIDYKKDRSRSKQGQIISKYAQKYPNDPFVKSKLNEKARFDGVLQPKPKGQVKEPIQSMAPNLRVLNNTNKIIRLRIYYVLESVHSRNPYEYRSLSTVVNPHETGFIRVPEKSKNHSMDAIDIGVTELLNEGGEAYLDGGSLRPINKGQVVDAVFGDDGKNFNERAGYTVPHVYEVMRR